MRVLPKLVNVSYPRGYRVNETKSNCNPHFRPQRKTGNLFQTLSIFLQTGKLWVIGVHLDDLGKSQKRPYDI